MARVNAWRCDKEGCKTEQIVGTIYTGTGGVQFNGATAWMTPSTTPEKEKPPQGWVSLSFVEGARDIEKHFCNRKCAAEFMTPYLGVEQRVNTAHEEREAEKQKFLAKRAEREASK